MFGKFVNRYSANMYYHTDGSSTSYSSRYNRVEYYASFTRRIIIPAHDDSGDQVYVALSDLEKLNWEEKADKKIFSTNWIRGGKLTKDDIGALGDKLSEYVERRGKFSSPRIILR